MPSESDADQWRFKLRLFASADLVGSTAFKAGKNSIESANWVSTFTEFFRDFPNALLDQYDKLPTSQHCPKVTERFQAWKFLGDEILFSVELKRHEDAASHVRVLKHTISDFPEIWRKKNLPLRLKGAAWLAGFPVTNREVHISTDGKGTILDFIGPSMDLGFRISKYCDEKRLVLSADLALMILDGVHSMEWKKEESYLLLHGKELLKGVLGNEGYPIVYLHMLDGKIGREEQLLGIKHEFNWSVLSDYLREFIDDRNPRLFRPFIEGDENSKYGKIPEDFKNLRDQLRTEESERGYEQQAAQPEPAPSGPPRIPSNPQVSHPDTSEQNKLQPD